MNFRAVRRCAAGVAFACLLAGTLPAGAFEVEQVTSPGGIVAWLVEDRAIPILTLAVGFRGAGAAGDPAGKEGLATMASGLLDEGAGELGSEAFQRRLADLAVDLSFDAGLDAFTGRLRTLSENRDQAFELLRLALTRPRFDAPAVERMRGQFLAKLAADATEAGEIAARAWWRAAYPRHAYGRPPDGTVAGIKAVEPADLARFVGRRFARDNLVVGVAGDIAAAELAPLLDRVFGALPAQAELPAPGPAEAEAPGEVMVIERDVPQSVVLFGHQGMARHDPDFYAAYLVNYILGGGGFASRLTGEVREKRGLAYSIDTALLTMDHGALVQGMVGTQNERVGESIEVIRQEWRRMREAGPTEQELTDAKTYVVGSYPLRFRSTTHIARLLVDLQLDGFPVDYPKKRKEYFERVTLADAARAARRLLDPARLTIVVVGKPVGVTPTRPAPEDGG